MNRWRAAVAALVALLLVGAALSLASFEAATGDTRLSSRASTASTNDAAANLTGTVSVYVAGDDRFAAAVERRLADALRERGLRVRTPETLRPAFDGPTLVVRVVERDVRYDPVTPAATVTWRFLYSASGNVSQFGRPAAGGPFDGAVLVERLAGDDLAPVVLSGDVRYVRWGSLTVENRATGVVSLPAYRGRLAGVVAAETVRAVAEPS